MNLTEWNRSNEIKEDMIYRGAAYGQVSRFRSLHEHISQYTEDLTCEVVSYHTSKSIKLPVVKYESKARGATLFVRDNFYNYACTFISHDDRQRPDLDRRGWDLSMVSSCYFEGFDDSNRTLPHQDPAPVLERKSDDTSESMPSLSFHIWSETIFVSLVLQLFLLPTRQP